MFLESLQRYRKAALDFLSSLAVLQKTQTNDFHAGTSYVRNTTRKQDVAYSFRYSSGSVFDVYSPGVFLNSEHQIIQSKNYCLQTFVNKTTSQFNWTRAEDLYCVETEHHSLVATTDSVEAIGALTSTIGNIVQYTDNFMLQVGQPSQEPIANNKNPAYGEANLLAINTISLQTKTRDIFISSAASLVGKSNLDIHFSCFKHLQLSTRGTGFLSADASLAVQSKGVLEVSSLGRTSISSTGITTINGSVILIGTGGGSFKKPVDLDNLSAASATDVVSQSREAPAGSISGFKPYPVVPIIKKYPKQGDAKPIAAASNNIVKEVKPI